MVMYDDTLDRQVLRLARHYHAKSPTTASLIPASHFPSHRQLSRATTQQQLVDQLLQQDEPNDGKAGLWEKVFWRRIVAGIEAGFEERRADGDDSVDDEEIHPSILEELVKHLSASSHGAPGSSLRRWQWGPLIDKTQWHEVVTNEDGKMISAGTTGLRTWQASISLSNHLIASPSLLASSSRVIELGAGVGLVSLVAVTLDPTIQVISTDVNPQVLHQLEANVKKNGIDDRIRTSILDWELASSLPANLNAMSAWESHVLGEKKRAELILGADIVYEPSLAGHLTATLAFLLRSSSDESGAATTLALIAGTIRNEATWQLFLDECRSRSLSIEPIDLLVPTDEGGIVGAEGWEGEGQVKLVKITAFRSVTTN